MLPGTYTVGVSAFGYADQSVDGVVVADGATVAENFTLAAVARVAVTGKVTDGSGQGWPLYATISVDGMPGGPVYTNPKTGAYTIQLPVNQTYNCTPPPPTPGIRPRTRSVTVGVSAVTQPISVKVDPATCTAAGYRIGQDGLYQTFDGHHGADRLDRHRRHRLRRLGVRRPGQAGQHHHRYRRVRDRRQRLPRRRQVGRTRI